MENKFINQVALFVDLDNFIGFCLGQQIKRDLKKDIKKLNEHGRVVIRKSFGDLYKIPLSSSDKEDIRIMLQENLFQHEDVRHRTQYKNSSDIRLIIEALSIAYTNPMISTFAIVADDRDYVPLFSKLRELGKTVIGIGSSEDCIDEYYRSTCDEFYYHSTIESQDIPTSARELSELKYVLNDTDQNNQDQAIALFLEAVKDVEDSDKKPLGTMIAEKMRHIKPGLKFEDYGVVGLKGIAALAERRGFIKTTPHGKDILVTCDDSKIEDYFECHYE